MSPSKPGLLDGVRILDFGIWRPAPHATQLLADMGALVCKVEPPTGDPMRAFPEIFVGVGSHKRSVVLDLKTDAGRERALELAAAADVVTEGFRPGVVDRLGVGDAAVRARNPSVVYCSVSGFGQTGPNSAVPGHDINYQALAGVMAPGGGPPVPSSPTIPYADLASGFAAAMAICAALFRRERTGEGEYIDVSMADALATFTGSVSGGHFDAVDGELDGGLATYGTFVTADGKFVALGLMTEDAMWRALCEAFGLDDMSELGIRERVERAGEIGAALTAGFAAEPRDELLARLGTGVPVSPVLSREEMLENEHFRFRGTVLEADDGRVATGFPVVLRDHPARLPGPAPKPDQDADDPWAELDG
ncbi:MAG: carnitine dehydratase [Actinomycetia bacterium]|nr:carnitine dehydratase [Actinomycetes bacterium]